MHNNISNNIVERCNEQIQLLAIHFFATTDSGVDHHHSVRCTVTVCRLHISIHCHGHNSIRYSDVYQQARSLAKSPYLPRQLRNDILDLRGGAPLLLRRILRGAVSLTLRTQIGRPEGAQLFGKKTIYCVSNTTEHILTKFGVLFNCMDSAWCEEDGFICMCIFMEMAVCFVQRGCATTKIIPSHNTYVCVRGCLESLTWMYIYQMRLIRTNISDVYEYCEMICPVRDFSPNTTRLFYWKLAAEVQYKATLLLTTLSDRIYPYKKVPMVYHWIPLNTIEYHWVPLDHSMVFQQDSVVFSTVI